MSLERKIYIFRVALWLVACVLIGGPLEVARRTIGEVAYVLVVIATLLIFHIVGLAFSKRILNRPSGKYQP